MVARNYIAKLFGSSPIKPLQKHMDSVQSCVSELLPFFKSIVANDWKEGKRIQKRIAKLEHEADRLKKDLRRHLPNSLFLPVSRRDLLETLKMQDNIANKAKDIAGLIIGRKMSFPEIIGDQIVDYIKRSIDASAQAQKAIHELDELVETGFRGKEVLIVETMINKLEEIESDTDRLQVNIRSSLYKIERDLPPVDVMFLYKIIEWIGDIGDMAERVGSRLQLMLAK